VRQRAAAQRRAEPEDRSLALVYGIHSVAAALDNPRRQPLRLLVTRNAAERLGLAGRELAIPVEITTPDAIAARLPEGAVHQGALLEAEPLAEPAIEDLTEARLLVVLDQVTDPQNVGAVLRSAAALGADALVITARHAPMASGALAKAASGALEHVPIVTIGNLGNALEALKQAGFRCIGLDSTGDRPLEGAVNAERIALVLGAEGKGLRQRTRQICDVVARIDLPGAIKSLNVSNAAVLALYIATRPGR
jgi:23S rRNA (guanosine2251-2'-O)-methyltransferase